MRHCAVPCLRWPLASLAVVDSAEHLPHGGWQTADGAAHCPNMERTEEFNRLVVDFLNENVHD